MAVRGVCLHADTPKRYKSSPDSSNGGDSFTIDPRGEIIAGPAERETILITEGSLDVVLAAKAAVDLGGHYSRPDIFNRSIDRRSRRRVREVIDAEGSADRGFYALEEMLPQVE